MKMRLFGTVLLLVFVLAPWAPTLAQSSAEKQAEARALGLIRLLSGGDPDAALAYVRENFAETKFQSRSEDDWKALLTRLTQDLGELDVTDVAFDEDLHLSISGTTPGGAVATLEFDFTAEPPHLIAGFGIGLDAGGGTPGAELPDPGLKTGMSRNQIAEKLEEYFHNLAEQDLFSGTALVAFDGKAVFKTAKGKASHRFNVPNTLATRFDVGSITKDFTKVAIGQLLSEGKLSLDDTIAKHIPDYPNTDVASRVTVKHLVEHTSGLGDIFNDRYFQSARGLLREPEDYFVLFADEALLFEPGTSSSYSNGGYEVLGVIIERVSRLSYFDNIDQNIFQPTGMKDSGFFSHDEPVPNVAIGYTRMQPHGCSEKADGDAPLRNNLLMLPVKGSPSGSSYSTVDDLLRYDNALRGFKLLSPAYTRWVFGGALPKSGYQAEVNSEKRLDVGVIMAGGAPGVSAVMSLEGDMAIIILSNYDERITEDIAKVLRRPLFSALKETL